MVTSWRHWASRTLFTWAWWRLVRATAFLTSKAISSGTLPTVDDSVVNLAGGEVSHLEIGACLLEERVVNSGWVGGNLGVSFRLQRGVRFHVGGTRGHG